MNKLKQLVYEKALYKKFRFWRYRNFPPKSTPQYWIKKYLKNTPLWIVQIGAHDGKDNDPLFVDIKRNDQWSCLFVEPVPYVFERLKNNYGNNSRYHFEMSAVNDGTEQIFYYPDKEAVLKNKDIPWWFDQLGSFDKENILNHIPALEPFIKEMPVKGITLPALLKKYNVDNLQLLLIDAEGYDLKVLSQFEFQKFKPLIILFEQSGMDAKEKNDAKALLEKQYFMFELGINFLCIEKNRFNKRDFKYLIC